MHLPIYKNQKPPDSFSLSGFYIPLPNFVDEIFAMGPVRALQSVTIDFNQRSQL
jgi:hypothetical protein